MTATLTGSSVQEIAEAIGAALGNVGIRYLPYLSDTFTPPICLVGIETVQYHGAFGNSDAVHVFTVALILARSSDRAGLEAMEAYMSNTGPQSVRVALEADQSLGGVVASCVVLEAGPPAGISINGGAEYIHLPIKVQVHAQ